METSIQTILEDHEKRIAELETKLNGPKPNVTAADKRTLNDYIVALREEGFFSQPKTAESVYDRLQQEYHCERNRVDVALFRLAEKKELRKSSTVVDSKRLKAYVW